MMCTPRLLDTGPFKAILSDMDGTLLYTEDANAMAYAAACAQLGHSVSAQALLHAIRGRHWSQFIPEVLGPACTPKHAERIAVLKKQLYPEYFHCIRENTLLVAMLRALAGTTRLALVTTASSSAVRSAINFFEWGNLFECIVTGDDVTHRKPHPEAYVLALRRLELAPENCLALEDSQAGLESAVRAGLQTLVVRAADA